MVETQINQKKKKKLLPLLFLLFAAVMKLDWIDTQIDRASLVGTFLLLSFGMPEIFSFHFAQIDRCFFAIFIPTLYGAANEKTIDISQTTTKQKDLLTFAS